MVHQGLKGKPMTVVAAPLAPDTTRPAEAAEELAERVSSVRITPDNNTVLQNLACLSELAGTWRGSGFNLIARPDFEDNANLYLQLNQTRETLEITPIGAAIPNRGFGQPDIALFGLTYLQKISDAARDGALHIEPGIWVIQPGTQYPPETASPGECLIARMGTIPHGNSLLAQGVCQSFRGFPTLPTDTEQYAFSLFPSFNSSPFPIPPAPNVPILNAAGSSEALTGQNAGAPPPGFFQYDIANGPGPIVIGGTNVVNTRTPYKTSPPEPPLPPSIHGVAMQDVVNDPIRLLQAVIEQQRSEGATFEGTVLNISTQADITFFQQPNSAPGSATATVNPTNGAGGVENILFLEGGQPTGAQGPNADTALVYATFWIEKVTYPHREPFMQLQYAQMVVLDFPIFAALHPTPPTLPALINFGWPHISVATLRKSFN
jgi:hypothetical protein